MMKRRDLMAMLAGAAAAWPATLRAATLPRVDFVATGFGSDTTGFDVIRDALRALGQIEGQSYQPRNHMSDDAAQFSRILQDVVQSKPDIIVTIESMTALKVFSLTHTIPIVVAFTGDPIVLGFTDSIGKPSANVTGIMGLQEELVGKRLEILREIVPSMRRVGILYEFGNATHELILAAGKKAAIQQHLEAVPLGIAAGNPIERVLDRSDTGHLDCLVVLGSPMMMSMRQSIMIAEQVRRIPAIYNFIFEVEEGALAAYGPEPAENFQRAAEYVDRLLHGAKIIDLPFEAPRTILLSFNLRTARAIGVTIPPMLLARADKVIE
jgi:putative tryptophan/tyrosine transport system substrate-binding protein